MRLGRLASLALAGALYSGAAMGDSINLNADVPNSTEQDGNFTGTASYDAGQLTITLTNTSTQVGLNITGFVFNSLDNSAAVMTPHDGDFGLSQIDLAKNLNASPFGTFEYGAGIGGDWEGMGQPTGGIGMGQTGTYVFNIDPASNLMNFFSEAGHDASPDHSGEVFVVRFRGGSGSDKTPTDIGGTVNEPPVSTPLPTTAVAGSAIMGTMFLGRRRRK